MFPIMPRDGPGTAVGPIPVGPGLICGSLPSYYGELGRLVAGWSFTNLLGAMSLQMFWLLTATETPQRCKNCDKRCSNRYTYLTTTKLRRQAARAV
jgi:hypothetical protein